MLVIQHFDIQKMWQIYQSESHWAQFQLCDTPWKWRGKTTFTSKLDGLCRRNCQSYTEDETKDLRASGPLAGFRGMLTLLANVLHVERNQFLLLFMTHSSVASNHLVKESVILTCSWDLRTGTSHKSESLYLPCHSPRACDRRWILRVEGPGANKDSDGSMLN